MDQFAQFAALGVSVVSFCLSLTAVLIQYAKRHEHPVVAPLEAEITTLKLGFIDLVDKLDHFTRRERTRRVREAQSEPEIPQPTTQLEGKAALRELARQRGQLR